MSETNPITHAITTAIVYNELSGEDDGLLTNVANLYVADHFATAIEDNPIEAALVGMVGLLITGIGHLFINVCATSYD